jgi:hypothetical protein
MIRPWIRRLFVAAAMLSFASAAGAVESVDSQTEDDIEPVMVDITDRKPPSEAEWQALQEDGQRGFSLGGLADFKAKTLAIMNTRYFTANSAEGTLASYGKMGNDKRYDRFGQIEGVEFPLEKNSWKKRFVMNGAALMKIAGSRFLEFAGVGIEGAADKKKQIEVTFVGTTVPKDEAIRKLNENIEALEYFDTLQNKRAIYDREKIKIFAGSAPPAPKVVLANVVMLDGKFSQALAANGDVSLRNRVLNDGVELTLKKNDGEELTLLSPVVRCYRTYSVEFKTGSDGQPDYRTLTDKKGRKHRVPQVFDLTPDL